MLPRPEDGPDGLGRAPRQPTAPAEAPCAHRAGRGSGGEGRESSGLAGEPQSARPPKRRYGPFADGGRRPWTTVADNSCGQRHHLTSRGGSGQLWPRRHTRITGTMVALFTAADAPLLPAKDGRSRTHRTTSEQQKQQPEAWTHAPAVTACSSCQLSQQIQAPPVPTDCETRAHPPTPGRSGGGKFLAPSDTRSSS
jgi:hypothetical protein